MLFADFPSAEKFFDAAVSSFVFGLIGIVLLVLGYKVFDWLTRSLHFQAERAGTNRTRSASCRGSAASPGREGG